jgi:DNA-binding CsgD family transcriptional regulator
MASQLFERILQSLGIDRARRSVVQVDFELMPYLEKIALQERKSVDDITLELLSNAVTERRTADEYLQLWEGLTRREKQTAAFACLGYTNQEIAESMVISTNTVRSHMRSILNKFNLNSKAELRTVLMRWDFNSWIEEQKLG